MTRPILISKVFFVVMLALYPITGIISGIVEGSAILILGATFGLLGALGIGVILYNDYRGMKAQHDLIEAQKERIKIQLSTIEKQAGTIGSQREQLDIYQGVDGGQL